MPRVSHAFRTTSLPTLQYNPKVAPIHAKPHTTVSHHVSTTRQPSVACNSRKRRSKTKLQSSGLTPAPNPASSSLKQQDAYRPAGIRCDVWCQVRHIHARQHSWRRHEQYARSPVTMVHSLIASSCWRCRRSARPRSWRDFGGSDWKRR